MNYFEYHGASFWDDRLEILEKAIFCEDIAIITCYHPRINPAFDKSNL